MYENDTITYIDILEIFHFEAVRLNKAIRENLKSEVLKEDGELFPAGTKLYKHVDPIIERGIIATSRLLLVNSETTSFHKTSELVKKQVSKVKRLKVELLKSDFRKFRKETNEIFQMFWHVEHLHKDLSDQRYQKYSNLMHSCAGPGTTTQIYDALINANILIDKLNSNYVEPVLRESDRLH